MLACGGVKRHPTGNVIAVIMKLSAAVCTAAALATAGCASVDSETSAAADVARKFVSAVQARNGLAACRLLSPSAEESLTSGGTPCEQAVLEVKTSGQPARTQVWGDEAQVRTNGDVVFLMHLKVGWRIRAAGCRPKQDRPYSCDMQA